jgi:hypothetical protein
MSFDLGQGAFSRSSSEMPILEQFVPHITFSDLATEFSTLNHVEDECLVPHSCIDGHHQGVVIVHETAHHICPRVVPNNPEKWKFDPRWRGLNMMYYMVPKISIDGDKDPWQEPSNRLYST